MGGGWEDVVFCYYFFFQAEDGIRALTVTGVQTCALPISSRLPNSFAKVSIGPPRCFCLDNRIIEQGTDGDPAMPSSEMKDFRELKVWQKAHQLTLAVYRITAAFPREELYGLTSQLRRAGSSIAANLAEGCGRNGD